MSESTPYTEIHGSSRLRKFHEDVLPCTAEESSGLVVRQETAAGVQPAGQVVRFGVNS